MFTSNVDVDRIILHDLSYDDMKQFCNTNTYTRHLCDSDRQLNKKLETIKIKVDTIIQLIPVNDNKINLPVNKSIKLSIFLTPLIKYGNTENRIVNFSVVPMQLYVIEMIVEKERNNYNIIFEVTSNSKAMYGSGYAGYVSYLDALDELSIKEFLINLYYDNYIM